MLREGGHRTRDARAFRIVHWNHISKPHPRHHLTSRRSPVARGAGLGLEVTERVPSGDLVPQPRKHTPTHHTPSVFCFFLYGPRGHRESFSSGAGRAVRGDVVVSHDVTTCHGGMTTQQVLSEGGDGPR